MLKGFKEFIMRGNVVDLAVAVVIGAAFNEVVNKIVEGLVNPLVAAIFNADSLKSLSVTIGSAELVYGAVIGALINFVIIAAVLYFCFVLPMNKWHDRTVKTGDTDPAPATETEILAEIRDLLAQQNRRL